jgi:hypothetical protein
MVCGFSFNVIYQQTFEVLMYPASCYYLASVDRPDSVGIRSYRYSAKLKSLNNKGRQLTRN